jgi:cytochrome b6-f complex iron-sulfur subunit
MERKDFIEKVGLSGAAILIFGCMQSCSKDSDMTSSPNTPPNTGGTSGGGTASTKIDFTIDIGVAPYDVLKKEGGFIVYSADKVIIARIAGNAFIAVSSLCTHAGATLEYISSTSKFYCSAHGSNFNQTGTVANGPATAALKQYKTDLVGNKLRIYE